MFRPGSGSSLLPGEFAVICSEACWEGSAEEASAVSDCLALGFFFLLVFVVLFSRPGRVYHQQLQAR